eukprot:s572_g24.t2
MCQAVAGFARPFNSRKLIQEVERIYSASNKRALGSISTFASESWGLKKSLLAGSSRNGGFSSTLTQCGGQRLSHHQELVLPAFLAQHE